jgi:hypothetical protein
MSPQIHPYAYDWSYEGPDPYQEPQPEPEHAWFAPFHQAARSGHVDGGAHSPSGPNQTGEVSDQPS